jgi:hypothetical protein
LACWVLGNLLSQQYKSCSGTGHKSVSPLPSDDADEQGAKMCSGPGFAGSSSPGSAERRQFSRPSRPPSSMPGLACTPDPTAATSTRTLSCLGLPCAGLSVPSQEISLGRMPMMDGSKAIFLRLSARKALTLKVNRLPLVAIASA